MLSPVETKICPHTILFEEQIEVSDVKNKAHKFIINWVLYKS